MSHWSVVPIVEGHGEQEAIRILLTRIWTELLGGDYLEVLRPIRKPRNKLVKGEELRRAVELAWLKLRGKERSLVLVLLDADNDLPCELGPELLAAARENRPGSEIACVLANLEYETWLVAAAESLADYLDLGAEPVPEDPEARRCGKAWIEKRFRGSRYSETVDQPAMTAKMDLALCRRRSASFDKLCRELAARGAPSSLVDA